MCQKSTSSILLGVRDVAAVVFFCVARSDMACTIRRTHRVPSGNREGTLRKPPKMVCCAFRHSDLNGVINASNRVVGFESTTTRSLVPVAGIDLSRVSRSNSKKPSRPANFLKSATAFIRSLLHWSTTIFHRYLEILSKIKKLLQKKWLKLKQTTIMGGLTWTPENICFNV